MLLRIAAAIVDAWLALGRAVHAVRPYWLAAPGDVLGRLVLDRCGVPPTAGRPVPVAGLPDAIIVEDPRLARYLDNVPLKPAAQTLGRYVIARGGVSDAIVRHELVHVRQWSRFGPFFLVVYGVASLVAILAGRHRYHDNVFEMAARAAEAEPAPAASSGATA